MSLLFNIVLGVLDIAIRQGKEIKGIQIVRKEVKLSLFANDIILHMKNVKVSTKKKTIKLINEFGTFASYNINIQKLVSFLYPIQ